MPIGPFLLSTRVTRTLRVPKSTPATMVMKMSPPVNRFLESANQSYTIGRRARILAQSGPEAAYLSAGDFASLPRPDQCSAAWPMALAVAEPARSPA